MQLPADATLDQAAAIALTLPAALAEGPGALRIDASQLKAYDSSTIALLLQARRLAQAAGRAVEIVGAPAQLAELAQLYGVADLVLGTAPASGSAIASTPLR
jgi:phospholipid transport system transporter-binding protein